VWRVDGRHIDHDPANIAGRHHDLNDTYPNAGGDSALLH
jgi:hypothetical protein